MKIKTYGEKELEYKSTEGKRLYIRGLMYIMTMAIEELYKESLLTINYQLDNSMYCTFENLEITEEILENIKLKMKEISTFFTSVLKVHLDNIDRFLEYRNQNNIFIPLHQAAHLWIIWTMLKNSMKL